MKIIFHVIWVFFIVSSTSGMAYPKIKVIKNNVNYLLIQESTLPIVDINISFNTGSKDDGSLKGLTNYAIELLHQQKVDGEKIICEGQGNGPVNALDNAIRQNVDRLAKYSKYLKDLKLVDYKVRILNTGTEAITRVSIESTDSKGKNWFTIGVSANIIDASFKALVDSLDYKLFKDNAPASL